MILSAGKPSDSLVEINRTIVAGRQLAGKVKIIAFHIGGGMLPFSLRAINKAMMQVFDAQKTTDIASFVWILLRVWRVRK